MKAIAAQWISPGSTGNSIGVVLMSNDMNQVTCRIGICGADGSVGTDKKLIMNRGGKLSMADALHFFPEYKDLINKNFKR